MMKETSFETFGQKRGSNSPDGHLDNILTPHTSPETIMALLSSSYHFTAAVPYMGLLPNQPMSAGSPNFSLMGLRIPPYFPAFVPGGNGAAALHAAATARFTQGSAFTRLSPEGGKKLVSPPYSRGKHGAILPLSFAATHRAAKVVDFSIDGILGNHRAERDCEEEAEILSVRKGSPKPNITVHISPEAENKSTLNEKSDKLDADNPLARFSWLQCTRYKPPRLPRTKRKDATKKRKLGRNPRVPFSPAQVATLEQKFRCTHYLSSYDVAELSTALNLSENRVKIWFQNRRARERRDKDAVEKSFNPTIVPASPPVASTSPTLHHATTTPSPPVTASIAEERHTTSPGHFIDHVTSVAPTNPLVSFPMDAYHTDVGLVTTSSYSPLDYTTK